MKSDEESIDFGITDGQKGAILNSLTKFGAVKAADQSGWEQGEWDFFRHQCKTRELIPDFVIEDVDQDMSGTARFIMDQAKIGASGCSEFEATPTPKSG